MVTDDISTTPVPDRKRRARIWGNWILALLTVPAAVLVRIFALGAVMSAAGCSTTECPDLGPSGFMFTVYYYGPLIVAGLTILASFFTAKRRWGIVVPLSALALMAVDVAALAVSFHI